MTHPEYVITARGMSKSVDNTGEPLTILHPLDLQVKAGEALSILGASGSGKSTLLSLLAGLDTPTTGTLELLGHTVNGLTEDQRAALRSGKIGFVFQSFMLLPSLTALENVLLPLQLQKQADAREKAMYWLEQVGLTGRAAHLPGQLSGGEQQRVAIARAFVADPVLIFADEPTGNLDRATGERISELLFREQQRRHSTLVLVTHDLQLAGHCSRTVTLNAGHLEAA